MDIVFAVNFAVFPLVVIGSALLLVAVLIMRRRVARGSRFSRAQRWIARLAVAGAVIPGASLLISGALRSELVTEPAWIIFLLLIPIGAALPSVIARVPIRTLCTVLGAIVLSAFCVLGAMSIGPLYVPAAALLLVAGVIGLIPPRPA